MPISSASPRPDPPRRRRRVTRLHRQPALPTVLAACNPERAARRRWPPPLRRLSSSPSLALLFSPALKSHKTGAPPPAHAAAAPSPSLPGWQIAWRSPEPLGPCLTNPAHTTRASGRSGQTTVGLEYSTGPLPHWRNRSTIRQTTSLPPPGMLARAAHVALSTLSGLFARLHPLSRSRVRSRSSSRDSKFK